MVLPSPYPRVKRQGNSNASEDANRCEQTRVKYVNTPLFPNTTRD